MISIETSGIIIIQNAVKSSIYKPSDYYLLVTNVYFIIKST